jgi:general secretion pathway protein G
MPRTRQGFSIVELLIVVVMLGILAAVVVPQFKGVTQEVQEAAIANTLQSLRGAIESYRLSHCDVLPDGDLVIQLTECTDITGAPGTELGPYLRPPWPTNPISGGNDVKVLPTTPASPAGQEAWLYNQTTGELRCNSKGTAPSGATWFDL